MNVTKLLAMLPSNTTSKSVRPSTKNQQISAFSQLLNGALNEKQTSNQKAIDLLSLLIEGQEETSNLSQFDKKEDGLNLIDMEALLAFFDNIFDSLPINQGFFDPDLLQNPEILSLINQLSVPVQSFLSEAIQSGMSFEQALFQTEIGSEKQLSTLLVAAMQLEKKQQIPEQLKVDDIIRVLQSQISRAFNVSLPEQSSNVSILASKLIESLNKNDTVNSSKSQNPSETGQIIERNKSELRGIIQKVLYSDSKRYDTNSQFGKQKEAIVNPAHQKLTTESINTDIFDQIVSGSIKEGGSLNRIQQYVLNVQQPTGSPLPEDQILAQLKNIMKQSKFSRQPNGTNQLLIKLNPAHLGSLTIKLSESNGEMLARIIVSSTTAKEVIESNLQGLRNVFTTQNINVEKFELQNQGESQFEDTKNESNQEQDQSKHPKQNYNQSYNSEEKEQSDSFKDELLNLMV